MIFPRKIDSLPRRREGSPRRRVPPRCGHVLLGKPNDNECGLSGPPNRGVARLGEPLRLG